MDREASPLADKQGLSSCLCRAAAEGQVIVMKKVKPHCHITWKINIYYIYILYFHTCRTRKDVDGTHMLYWP
jgi:hypothetical protein